MQRSVADLCSVSETTPEQAEYVLGLLDDDTWETEQLLWTPEISENGSVLGHVLKELRESKTLWMGPPAYRAPLCSFAILPPKDGRPAIAWMKTTSLVKENQWGMALLHHMRCVLRDAVKEHTKVCGVVRTTSDIPRLLKALGATFIMPLPDKRSFTRKFLLWELRDNYKLRK